MAAGDPAAPDTVAPGEPLAEAERGAKPAAATDPEAPTEPASTMSVEMAGARPEESAALVLARARVAAALFGDEVGLGRFRVLERLGGGGMGVVYAAYDPELDRGVALKTVHVPRVGREIALGEAKALARLAHPNVVPVFDVGASGDHVYIVMELVRGETLGAWAKAKTVAEIVEVYRQAGQALAAAHGAGLVHRDFKPDNAIVGTDGRVRVVDFGLACEAAPPADATEPTGESRDGAGVPARPRVGGTPRYMAPEQAAGAPVTPAADQYSFGVSLAEALRTSSERPVPRWLELVIERATAADPAARFASMPAVLRALGRDPARLRRRSAAAATVAAIVVAAFAIGRGLVASEAPCSGGDRALAAAWDGAARQRALVRIAVLSPYGADLVPRLAAQLNDHAARWIAGHRAACLAHRRGEQSAALLDRRMACLDRGRAALGALADIAGAADAAALPGMARAARALPDPDTCGDVRALTVDVEPAPPGQAQALAALADDIERARVQLAAGRADDASRGAAHAVAVARRIGYRPVLAEALLVDGHAAMAGGDRSAAVARLTEATALGLASGSEAIAIEAWARRAWVEGTGGRPEAALDGYAVIDALASRSPSAFARALLHNNVGSIELGRGQRVEARAVLTRALDDARPVIGAGAVELVAIRTNLALASDEPGQSDALLADAHAEFARLLGAGHPDALTAQFIRANTSVVSLVTAAALVDETCRGRETTPGLTKASAICWLEAADLHAELGDRTGAIAALERARRLGGDANPDTTELPGYLALWRGDAAAAVTAFSAQLAEIAERPGEPWYRTLLRARLSLGLGRALAAAHHPGDAAGALERAIALLAPLAVRERRVAIDRRLGRARAELAKVRAALGAPPDQTRVLAAAALTWLRAAGAPAAELTALAALSGSG